MPLSDLPMPILFLFFLLLFLLVGLYPAWKRTAAKIKQLLKPLSPDPRLPAVDSEIEPSELLVEQSNSSALDDFEIMVLRELAQGGVRGLSSKQLDAALFLGKETINKSLQTLTRRGFVRPALSSFLILRFYLSDQGRLYAIDHEFIPKIHLEPDSL